MYASESLDDTVCTLGMPGKLQNPQSVQPSSKTFVGGCATWQTCSSFPNLDELFCQHCGSNSKMVLVAQVYAPLDFDRSLHIFCCNTRSCSLNSSGWLVIRTQVEPLVTDAILPSIQTETLSPKNIMKPVKSVVEKKTNSAWGDFSFEEDECTMDDLTELLNIRDMKISETNPKPLISKQIAPPVPPNAIQCQTKSHLNCWDITEMDEIWTSEDEIAALEGVVMDTGGDGAGSTEHIDRLLKSYYEGEEDLEIVNLVKKQQITYNKSNESKIQYVAENLNVVNESNTTITGTAMANNDHIQTFSEKPGKIITNKTKKSKPSPSGTSKSRSNTAKAKEGDGGESSDDEELKEAGLARSSQRQRIEAYFQYRVSYYPAQVLRYAYGGAPLWITYPSPLNASTSKNTVDGNNSSCNNATGGKSLEQRQIAATTRSTLVPPCEWCGKARVFECQLMPGLLSLVSATASTTTTGAATTAELDKLSASVSTPTSTVAAAVYSNDILAKPSAEDLQRFQQSLGDELDFGVVAIYVCPDSCSSSCRKKDSCKYATEVAIVQAPSDII